MIQFKVFKCDNLRELESVVNTWLETMGENLVVHSHSFTHKRRDEASCYASFTYSVKPNKS